MRRTLASTVLYCALTLLGARATAAEPPRFEWQDGDRVVLIGDTLIERDQKYGYLETLITAQNPDKTITFRNLGWSGDTVRGLSRSRFGPPSEGWDHLKEHVLALKPTVLIVGYGMADSFDGEAGLPAFVSGLNALLDTFAPLKARVVLLSPIAHEDLGRPLPEPAAHNRALGLYRDAIKVVARERSLWFFDLYQGMEVYASMKRRMNSPGRKTDDGIHYTEGSYAGFGLFVGKELAGYGPGGAGSVAFERDGTVVDSGWADLARVEPLPDGLRFKMTVHYLPLRILPRFVSPPNGLRLQVRGLPFGRYRLKVDGNDVANASAAEWRAGVEVGHGPDLDQAEALRKVINEKNLLYFHRWRPQNETYLFGFRKHEQGNNAREIPLFDPLVEAKEKEIARVKKPARHVYELTRVQEPKR